MSKYTLEKTVKFIDESKFPMGALFEIIINGKVHVGIVTGVRDNGTRVSFAVYTPNYILKAFGDPLRYELDELVLTVDDIENTENSKYDGVKLTPYVKQTSADE